jgi:para-nitrobenzyl esterase
MTQTALLFILGALTWLSACAVPDATRARVDRALVTVEGGTISGAPASEGEAVWVYKGIPYAAPPVGELRWRPPRPVEPWDGVRKATQFAPACMQPRRPADSFYGQIVDEADAPHKLRMAEDCLYLNVWTAAPPDDRAPVMVWIHGGGLSSGHGAEVTYDGIALARRGVVVVTINYRLGPFGYLAHALLSKESEHQASGNYGTLDQVAALEWVQKNIAAFGGEPKRVTIFGESAGSWSINHMMATPLAKGLFHGAIGQSGGGFGSFGSGSRFSGRAYKKAEVEAAGERFAEALVGPDASPSLEVLRSKTAEEVMAAMAVPSRAFRISPNVDGWVFPDTIYNIFAAGAQNDVPVIVGSNADEGASLGGAARGPTTIGEYRKYARTEFGELADAFLAAYPAKSDEEARHGRIGSYTDQSFGWEMRMWARMMDTVSSKAYLYFFSRVAPSTDAERYGAFHAAEIIYVFNSIGKSPYPYANRDYDDTDRKLSNLMASYWVNFATRGNPNGDSMPEWPAYSRDADEALEFGDTVQVRHGIRKDRLDFQDRYYAAQRGKTN